MEARCVEAVQMRVTPDMKVGYEPGAVSADYWHQLTTVHMLQPLNAAKELPPVPVARQRAQHCLRLGASPSVFRPTAAGDSYEPS